MKPRKSWEPEYRFGGSKNAFDLPSLLGTTYRTVKPKKPKPKGKRK